MVDQVGVYMTKYPMTINLSQELVEKLRKEKENNPKFRPSHLIEDLLKDHFNDTFSLSNRMKEINSDLQKELKA